MNCIICDSAMNYFFTKTFNALNLTDVHYWKCVHCGFCASKTHFDMDEQEWATLNNAFHSESHHREDNPYNRNQRYFNQALMLHLMVKQGLIVDEQWMDWGAGIGSLALLLKDYFNLHLMAYDKYFVPEVNPINEELLKERAFNLVVNTAVFEHVRNRQTLNEIESYVSSSGCFAIHTLVPEHVPQDPNWMYLLPVHCAFHTNQSMEILMQQWGYTCSVYNEHSKMWVLFRHDPAVVGSKVNNLNRSLGWEYLHFKNGFMDYWK